MSRRMSVALTLPAVRAKRKRVTRRRADTWKDLKPGDRLTLVEKGMGLPKGAKQVVVTTVEIVDVRVEPLSEVLTEENALELEGLETMSLPEFVDFWMRSHGYDPNLLDVEDVLCRRIEWKYL